MLHLVELCAHGIADPAQRPRRREVRVEVLGRGERQPGDGARVLEVADLEVMANGRHDRAHVGEANARLAILLRALDDELALVAHGTPISGRQVSSHSARSRWMTSSSVRLNMWPPTPVSTSSRPGDGFGHWPGLAVHFTPQLRRWKACVLAQSMPMVIAPASFPAMPASGVA